MKFTLGVFTGIAITLLFLSLYPVSEGVFVVEPDDPCLQQLTPNQPAVHRTKTIEL